MEIVIPAAGLSSRFPNMKPKYLLYDFQGNLMIKNAVAPWIGRDNITIGILKEHDQKYHASEIISSEIPEARIIIIDEPTRGPADTVSHIIERANLSGALLIKDCDSFFTIDPVVGNSVCVSYIDQHEVLKKLASKSFVRENDQNVIIDIVEKQVVSNCFCVGGYQFEDSSVFLDAFNALDHTTEVFVSHVILQAMIQGSIFTTTQVSNYVDVGTAEDWFEYNDRPTIFCDIDGTLIQNQDRCGPNAYSTSPIVLKENVDRIKQLINDGCQVIFVTSRPNSAFTVTSKMLENLGLEGVLITGLNNTRRILINDYNTANPYPRAEAINIPRNSDTLKDFL